MKIVDTLRIALVAVALAVVAIPQAEAQRRGGGSAPEPLFPAATREEPRVNMSQRVNQRLTRLNDLAADGADPQRVIEQADALINDTGAGEYARSFALTIKADALDELDQTDAAIEAYKQSMEIGGLPNNQHYQVMLRTGQTLVFEERFDEGIALLERFFAETGSEAADHLALMGSALYQSDRFAEAVDYMSRAIAAREDAPESWHQVLMISYQESGQMDQAVDIARRTAEANPDDKTSQMNYAATLYNADQVDEAAAVLDAAHARGLFTEARDYDQLARMHMAAGNDARGAQVMRDGLESGLLEGNYENYSMLGQALYFSDDFAGAAEAWTRAAETAPDGEMAFNAARAYLDAERWDEAIRWANRALERGMANPDNARNVIQVANQELGR